MWLVRLWGIKRLSYTHCEVQPGNSTTTCSIPPTTVTLKIPWTSLLAPIPLRSSPSLYRGGFASNKNGCLLPFYAFAAIVIVMGCSGLLNSSRGATILSATSMPRKTSSKTVWRRFRLRRLCRRCLARLVRALNPAYNTASILSREVAKFRVRGQQLS